MTVVAAIRTGPVVRMHRDPAGAVDSDVAASPAGERRPTARTRCDGQSGQAAPLVIGLGLVLLSLVAFVFLLGRAHTAKAVAQTGADLTAVQTGRLIRNQMAAIAAHTPGRRAVWRRSIRRRAEMLARNNGSRLVAFSFPEGDRWPPTEVQVSVETTGPMSTVLRASARAAIRPGTGGTPESGSSMRGGQYTGPLVHRDGKPICPVVAAAFDRMDAAAGRAGVSLVVTSGFRSDAEQAVLFARHPDPKWVARPGHSRHRQATELDIAGTPGAWDWLARYATLFGFVQRYSWEPWHYGFTAGCGVDAASGADGSPSTSAPGPDTLPDWVPPRYRALVLSGARQGGVPPIVLAALLRSESGFDPMAVSRVGAQGIAQFMPETARGVGLADPFDPDAAIPAAGRYLGGLLRQFGSIPLALAAYNAGAGNVLRYGGIPPFRETQAYVARILALIGDPTIAMDGRGGATVELVRIDQRLV